MTGTGPSGPAQGPAHIAEDVARLEAAEAAAWKLYEALLNATCRTELGTQRRNEALHAWMAYDQDFDRAPLRDHLATVLKNDGSGGTDGS